MVRLAELAEAEGRVARQMAFRLVVALVVALAGAAMLLGALSLFLAAAYVALIAVVGVPVALVIIACGLLVVALCFILLSREMR